MQIDLASIMKSLKRELDSNGIQFTPEGYPIIPKKMLLKEIPDEILPFEHRNQCRDKRKTILCSFANDELLYRRLKSLEKDLGILKEYMGVIGFDLSPRLGEDIKQQKLNLLINQMVNAYRAIHGIKILSNFRTGDIRTVNVLNSYPPNSWYAVGTLGCSRGHVEKNSILLRTKLIYARPERLLIYGMLRREYKEILDELGIPYNVYQDFKNRSFQNYKSRRKMI